MEKDYLSRREFLKLAGTLPFTGISTLGRENDKKREITIKEMVKKLNDPDFYTKAINNQTVQTLQFDEDGQYDFTPDKSEEARYAVMNNAYVGAATATILKAYSLFQTGEIPNITIQGIWESLKKATYKQKGNEYPFPKDNLRMGFDGMMATVEHFANKGNSIEVFPITPISGHSLASNIYPLSRKFIDKSNELVLSKGGMLVFFVGNYKGHFIVVTNLRETPQGPRCLVVDPRGPRGEGIVQDVVLGSYLVKYDGRLKEYKGRLMFLGAFGIVPTFLDGASNIPNDIEFFSRP